MNLKSILHCFLLAIFVPTVAFGQDNLKIRSAEISKLLLDHTSGYTAPIEDREVWGQLQDQDQFQRIIAQADSLLKEPFPFWNDSLIMQYPKTGNRVTPDRMMANRGSRLMTLVYAEALQNKGRYLKAIDRTLNEICTQPTWVGVAHDRNLDNFWGRESHVDLNSSNMADNLGQTLYILGSNLDEMTTARVRRELDRRVYQPVLKSIRTGDLLNGKHYWFEVENNWNLVCLAGVTNSALAVIEDIELRAEFVAAAEHYIQYGLNGFMEDGYCVEGVGYYNYGFTFFLYLREGVYRATQGAIELFDHPYMQKIATYGERSEIINGVYPAISDCKLGSVPSPWIQWYCNQAYGWQTSSIDQQSDSFYGNNRILDPLIASFSQAPYNGKQKITEQSQSQLRSYFDKAAVITFRPQPTEHDQALAVTIKGGHNGESHNHNDVGSYTIVMGQETMMGDMGGPNFYNGDTFSAKRYTFPLFSAYGHPVPVYGGAMQYNSAEARGEVTQQKFSEKRETITYDISSCYKKEELQSATRQFVYERQKQGLLTVTDRFKATKAISYENVITTRARVEIQDQKIILSSQDQTLEVTINAPSTYSITTEVISDPSYLSFTRISIKLDKELESGEISLSYKTL